MSWNPATNTFTITFGTLASGSIKTGVAQIRARYLPSTAVRDIAGNALDDAEGLAGECRHGRALGFDGSEKKASNVSELYNPATNRFCASCGYKLNLASVPAKAGISGASGAPVLGGVMLTALRAE